MSCSPPDLQAHLPSAKPERMKIDPRKTESSQKVFPRKNPPPMQVWSPPEAALPRVPEHLPEQNYRCLGQGPEQECSNQSRMCQSFVPPEAFPSFPSAKLAPDP